MDQRKAYKFCPLCSGNLVSQQDFLKCSKCGYPVYINPVPCNGAIIENEKGEILLVKRMFAPKKGYWDLPGGFLDAFEDWRESVGREVLEELNIKIEINKIVGVYSDTYIYKGIKRPTLGIIVSAKVVGGDFKIADDISEFKFFPKDEILKQRIGFPSIRKAIADYLQEYQV